MALGLPPTASLPAISSTISSPGASPLGRQKLTQALGRDYRRLVNFAKSRLTDKVQDQDAEDLLADVVLNLLERGDLLAEIENVTAYLFTALAHRVTDLFRRKREEPLSDEQSLARPAPGNLQQQLELSEALDLLSTAERAVWLAVEWEGRSFAELAELWGEPIGTLLSRKSRATGRLRKLMTNL